MHTFNKNKLQYGIGTPCVGGSINWEAFGINGKRTYFATKKECEAILRKWQRSKSCRDDLAVYKHSKQDIEFWVKMHKKFPELTQGPMFNGMFDLKAYEERYQEMKANTKLVAIYQEVKNYLESK